MFKRSIPFLLLLLTLAQAQTHEKLNAGPMLSYSEMREVAVWVQTTRPAAVRLQFWKKDAPTIVRDTEEIRTSEAGDHIALFRLKELDMGARFAYRLLIDGQEVRRDYPLEFQTQPHWRFAQNPAQPPNFSALIGSCMYINDAPFDRPGRPYGGDYQIYTAMHRVGADFMIWLGDNVYYREMDWLTEPSMRYRWRKDRSLPEMQPLLGSIHHYATWDDHDFGPNDSDRSYRLRGQALRIFADYFPAVQYGTPETPGVFQRFEWGDVEFFMLDNRYHRSPNRAPIGPDKVMLGPAQVQWLKDSLINSNATFKVIVSGGQMITENRFEHFGLFPDERKDLFDFIAAQRIQGVVFLSGDRHATFLLKREWPGAAYPWYEYTSSPVGSGVANFPAEDPHIVPGYHVNNTRNFGVVKMSGPRGQRVMTWTCHDPAGKELWKFDIKESDLRPPKAQ